MLPVVLSLLVLVALAVLVLATVAVPARRGGREVLTDRGEHLVGSVRHRVPARPALGGREHVGADSGPVPERDLVGS